MTEKLVSDELQISRFVHRDPPSHPESICEAPEAPGWTNICENEPPKIAKSALKNNTTLKFEATKSGLISAKDFDRIVDPKKMTYPG